MPSDLEDVTPFLTINFITMKSRPLQTLVFLTFVFLSQMAFGQSETHNMVTYDTIIPYKCLCNAYDGCDSDGIGRNWVVRITRPVNYFTAGNADTASRYMLLTMQGDGQVGDSTSLINADGPHYW